MGLMKGGFRDGKVKSGSMEVGRSWVHNVGGKEEDVSGNQEVWVNFGM